MDTGLIGDVGQTPEEAVATIVLLDQLPRNMYRGMEAAKVRPTGTVLALRLLTIRHIKRMIRKLVSWPSNIYSTGAIPNEINVSDPQINLLVRMLILASLEFRQGLLPLHAPSVQRPLCGRRLTPSNAQRGSSRPREAQNTHGHT
jgi:hypothetical protein